MPEMLPQHDLDAQRTLGRAWITLAGRKACELERAEAVVARLKEQIGTAERNAHPARTLVSLELDAAIQPLFGIEADLRKIGYQGDALLAEAAEGMWTAIGSLQDIISNLQHYGR